MGQQEHEVGSREAWSSGGPATMSLPPQDTEVLSRLFSALGALGTLERWSVTVAFTPLPFLGIRAQVWGESYNQHATHHNPGVQCIPVWRLQSLGFTHLPWIKAAILRKGEIDFSAPG